MLQIHQLTCLFLKWNMFGLGNLMMRYVMKNVDTLPSLIDQAVEQGVKVINIM